MFLSHRHNYNYYGLLLKTCSRTALLGVLFSAWCGRLCQLFNRIGFLLFLSTQLDDLSHTPLQFDAPCNRVLTVGCEHSHAPWPVPTAPRSLSFGLTEMAALHLSSVASEIIFFKWQRQHSIQSYKLYRNRTLS